MHQHLLLCNDFALEECASLQPNSRLWQTETGYALKGGNGFSAAPMGYLLAADSQDARGVVRPIDGLTMLNNMVGGEANGGNDTLATNASDGMLGFAGKGGMMRKERPAIQGIRFRDYNNGSTGTIGYFNKLNTGSHSRPGGLPPLIKAPAPPGGARSADPGGGPTAS